MVHATMTSNDDIASSAKDPNLALRIQEMQTMTTLSDTEAVPEERSPRVLSVIKAFALLETIITTADSHSLKDLSTRHNMHPSTVHRLLHTLIEIGYVRQDPHSRRYYPGARVDMLRQVDHSQSTLQQTAMPRLRALAEHTKENVSLYVLEGQNVVHLAQIESPNSVQVVLPLGARLPVYSTASGKVLLAHLDVRSRKNLLEQLQLEQHTPNTITHLDDLRVELDRIRRRKYAVDDEEQELGMRGIAAVVRDASGHGVGAVSLSGPSARISVHRLMELSQLVQDTAATLSHDLGYESRPDSAS
jgi:IclR family acetate operon transcriptional repressor